MKPVIVVQGAQWGSEAKGAIAGKLCIDRNVDYAVRTGAINAGHTVAYKGERYAFQQLPTGWINPHTNLVIGAGAYIHPDTLWKELGIINRAMPDDDVRTRLYIDYRCGIHTEEAEKLSKDANRHHKIGATGKGCSEAIVAKIRNRNDGYELFINSMAGRVFREHNPGVRFCDTSRMLNGAIDGGAQVLLEGTQGTLLDLHLGPYPFTTSRMTSAANWVAEAGLSPSLQYEVILVARTFPIRVAGNSGPMSNEIEWLDLAREINNKLRDAALPVKVKPRILAEFEANLMKAAEDAIATDRYPVPANLRMSTWTDHERSIYRVAASELNRDALNLCSEDSIKELKKLFEMTTVTKKLRRIARFSYSDLKEAININRPASIVLTFMDYLEPELAGHTSATILDVSTRDTIDRAINFIKSVEESGGVKVSAISVGPAPENVIDVARLREFVGAAL